MVLYDRNINSYVKVQKEITYEAVICSKVKKFASIVPFFAYCLLHVKDCFLFAPREMSQFLKGLSQYP